MIDCEYCRVHASLDAAEVRRRQAIATSLRAVYRYAEDDDGVARSVFAYQVETPIEQFNRDSQLAAAVDSGMWPFASIDDEDTNAEYVVCHVRGALSGGERDRRRAIAGHRTAGFYYVQSHAGPVSWFVVERPSVAGANLAAEQIWTDVMSGEWPLTEATRSADEEPEVGEMEPQGLPDREGTLVRGQPYWVRWNLRDNTMELWDRNELLRLYDRISLVGLPGPYEEFEEAFMKMPLGEVWDMGNDYQVVRVCDTFVDPSRPAEQTRAPRNVRIRKNE